MKPVLADANIFTYAVRHYATDVAGLLEKLEKIKLQTAIATYTSYEVYRGLSNDRIQTMNELVTLFTPIEVDKDTFRIAAALTTCYNNAEATKDHKSSYDDGDVILAATAIQYGAYILTANVNDFPRPFFEEARRFSITNENTQNTVHVGLLFPDPAMFMEKIAQYYPKKK